jgi:endonuclease YncB( thermonuclease family)
MNRFNSKSSFNLGLSVIRCVLGGMALLMAAGAALAGDRLVGMEFDKQSADLYVGGEPVRLIGIHFPSEQGICSLEVNGCKHIAMTALSSWLESPEKVECNVFQVVNHGVHMAQCKIDDEDLAAWLVGRGLALADRRSSRAYVRDEQAARKAGFGLWGILEMVAFN